MPRRKRVDIELEGLAGKLGPEVYSESPGFICLLPADVKESVRGHGDSIAEAVKDWDIKLKSHLSNSHSNDPVVIFVKDHLSKDGYVAPKRTNGKPTWSEKPQHVIDFESQFYSGKKKIKD